jgi:hypothetical protein
MHKNPRYRTGQRFSRHRATYGELLLGLLMLSALLLLSRLLLSLCLLPASAILSFITAIESRL